MCCSSPTRSNAVEDLRGKKFGVSRIGSADNAVSHYGAGSAYGIKENDVTYVQAGNIPARLAAMQSNALQATLLQAPETLKAKEIGLRPLLDFTKLDVEWQQNGVAYHARLYQEKTRHGAPLHAALTSRQCITI